MNKTNGNIAPLKCGKFYHIYNKSIGTELLFKTKVDYLFFLKKLKRFILPIADIFAYCLMPNHFHLLLKIKNSEDIPLLSDIEKDTVYLTQQFSNFFISYSKSFNKTHNRLGRLLLQPFKRKVIEDEAYLTFLVAYIHRNPIHHGLVKNFSDWKYSSYNSFITNKSTDIEINRNEVLSYFYSLDEFIEFHSDNRIEHRVKEYSLE